MDHRRDSRQIDSYRPPPRPYQHSLPRRPPTPPSFRFGESYRSDSDSYNRTNFSFRSNYPGRPAFTPSNPPPAPRGQSNGRNWRGEPRNFNRRPEPRYFGHGRGARTGDTTSSRPLLRIRRSPTPDQFPEMAKIQPRFKDLENLSNSEEEDMDLDSEAGGLANDNLDPKTASAGSVTVVQSDKTDDENEKPKWSNPDPYTSLPPPEEPSGKRKDVVNFIRKARTVKSNIDSLPVEDNYDFISFETDITNSIAPEGSVSDSVKRRKRKIDDAEESHMPDDIQESSTSELRSGKKRIKTSDDTGNVRPEWQAVYAQDASPWLAKDAPFADHPIAQLDREIRSFYEFVRPRRFETDSRNELMRRLSTFANTHYLDCAVHCFGSFAAGLYLPDGDMDVVILSRGFELYGRPRLMLNKGELYSFANKLRRDNFAITSDQSKRVVVVANAKVPIVKFVDSKTLLRVDVSFENDTGLAAIRTYRQWMARFPMMPHLVCLIKQFLLMRGLNEVQHGGLGGFSVSCMVVSLLENHPELLSPREHNLGDIFLAFLDFYGNKFNYIENAIVLNPPRIAPKVSCTGIKIYRGKPWQLCIVDPNNSTNNISGGTHQIRLIQQTFSEAHEILEQSIRDFSTGDKGLFKDGILGCLYAGNYNSFLDQRAHLEKLSLLKPRG